MCDATTGPFDAAQASSVVRLPQWLVSTITPRPFEQCDQLAAERGEAAIVRPRCSQTLPEVLVVVGQHQHAQPEIVRALDQREVRGQGDRELTLQEESAGPPCRLGGAEVGGPAHLLQPGSLSKSSARCEDTSSMPRSLPISSGWWPAGDVALIPRFAVRRQHPGGRQPRGDGVGGAGEERGVRSRGVEVPQRLLQLGRVGAVDDRTPVEQIDDHAVDDGAEPPVPPAPRRGLSRSGLMEATPIQLHRPCVHPPPLLYAATTKEQALMPSRSSSARFRPRAW